MNTLFQRLQPLDYILVAAFIVVSLLLFTSGPDSGSGVVDAPDAGRAPAWDDSLRAVSDAIRADDLEQARAAFVQAAAAARAGGEPGTARVIEAVATRLYSLDAEDIGALIVRELNDDIGPRLAQFIAVITAAHLSPPFPDEPPRRGNGWGFVAFVSEDGPIDRNWASVSWTMADTPLSMRAHLATDDADAEIDLTLDFSPPGAIVLALTRFPGEARIVDTVPFVPMSYADLSLASTGALVLEGSVTVTGNRVALNLDPDDRVMLIRSLEAAPELMIVTRFDDGSSAVIRFEFNSAVRDLLRRVRESLQATP